MQALSHQKIKKFFKSQNPSVKDIRLSFFLQSIDSAINVGHIFRLADAVNATEIILSGRTPNPKDNGDIKITSMGQENRIKYTHFVNHIDAINYCKNNGYNLYGLEVTEKSELFTQVEYSKSVCLVLGNETNGIYPEVLHHCDKIIFIPMFGKNFSLNVHVSASIVAYQALLSH